MLLGSILLALTWSALQGEITPATIEANLYSADLPPLDLLAKGHRYREVPITYTFRASGESFVKLGRYDPAVQLRLEKHQVVNDQFAANMALQYLRVGPWRSYLFGERMYLVLSLVAKSVLAWQVFAGALAG